MHSVRTRACQGTFAVRGGRGLPPGWGFRIRLTDTFTHRGPWPDPMSLAAQRIECVVRHDAELDVDGAGARRLARTDGLVNQIPSPESFPNTERASVLSRLRLAAGTGCLSGQP